MLFCGGGVEIGGDGDGEPFIAAKRALRSSRIWATLLLPAVAVDPELLDRAGEVTGFTAGLLVDPHASSCSFQSSTASASVLIFGCGLDAALLGKGAATAGGLEAAETGSSHPSWLLSSKPQSSSGRRSASANKCQPI